jgi:hypothetical protein
MSQPLKNLRSIPSSPLCNGQTSSSLPQKLPATSPRQSPEPNPGAEILTPKDGTLRSVPDEVLQEVALRIARLAVRYYQHITEQE